MSDADQVKGFINAIFQDGVQATLKSGMAMADIDNAIAYLRLAIEYEKTSIGYSQQEAEYLDMIIEKTRLLMAGSATMGVTNMPVMVALGHFESAKQSLDDFAARTYIQITEAEKLIAILQSARRDQELVAAEQQIGLGMSQLEAYRGIL
jgi:hypothetical protein